MIPRPGTLECGRQGSRGQPVIALAMIMGAWIAVRVTFIALDSDSEADSRQMAGTPRPAPRAPAFPKPASPPLAPPAPDRPNARLATLAVPYVPRRSTAAAAGKRLPAVGLDRFFPPVHRAKAGLLPSDVVRAAPEELAAAFGLPEQGGTLFTGPQNYYLAPAARSVPSASAGDHARPQDQRRLSRWSADGWLLLRGGDQPPALAAGTTAYGGSQAGAVLRYRLAPSSALRPQAYLRVSGALGGRVRQSEAALGLAVRPLQRLPLAVLGELRLQEQPGLTRTRPVVMTITELPPLSLPLGIEAEAYAQGGWAGGSDATPFFDLAATLQRRLARPLNGSQLAIGGGVWSGGQRGASRVDVGPRVELRGTVGPPSRWIGVRVGVDWRFRVAGKAEPGSGPALTVAAGF